MPQNRARAAPKEMPNPVFRLAEESFSDCEESLGLEMMSLREIIRFLLFQFRLTAASLGAGLPNNE